MRAALAALWLALAAGWLSGIVVIAKLIGGARYIAHMGLSAQVTLLTTMGALCAAVALGLVVLKTLPRALSAAVAIGAGLHLLNAVGVYIMLTTNGHASPGVMLPFVLLGSLVPTTTTFYGMPPGNGGLFLLPAATLVLLAVSVATSAPARARGEAPARKPLVTGTRVVRITVALGLAFACYIGLLQLWEWSSHRPRKTGETWTLFERERQERQAPFSEKLRETCGSSDGRGTTPNPTATVVGLRVLEIAPIADAGARGWESGLAFFLGGQSGPGVVGPVSVLEGLQNAIRRIDEKRDPALNPDPPFIEYRGADGRFKRYARQPPSAQYAEHDAVDSLATRGLRIVQVRTGLESSHFLYRGRLEFTDLSTGAPAGQHESSATDLYYGAHNNFALIPAQRCSGLPHAVDFLTNQLAPHFAANAKKHFVF